MKKSFWDKKNILVTGANGFKGSHLVEELSSSNARIVSLVRNFSPKSYFETQNLGKKSIPIIGDLKDQRRISEIISKYEIDTIFHLAAQPIVTSALLNPLETLESNIMGTVNILESARAYPHIKRIVVVSSDKAYGPAKKLPYDETERLHGQAPYDVSKSCADLIAQMYAKVYHMPITISRCANVFGPGDLNMSRIVPGIIESIITKMPLQIRSDGKMVREYIYVSDSVNGYITLAENIDKTRGEAFNIASGNRLSVLELVNKISTILGKKVDVIIQNLARTEIPEQYLDGNKIKNLLGWEARTPLDEAVKKTFDWYSKIILPS
jgi:CDP-glucose 4,6-dehydratase